VIHASRRLDRLPPYAVAELAVIKQRLIARGVDVIDVSAGDANMPPPPPAVDAISEAVRDPAMSRYAYQVGLREFRESATRYMERRFKARFDPDNEVLPLIGSKEGLAHLALAFVNPGQGCVLPDPGYPAYLGGAVVADAEVVRVPLRPENGFLLELDYLTPAQLSSARLVYLNYPNNPTAAVAPRDYLERTIETCRRHGILLAYDNPYCEVTFDGYRAPSIFEIDSMTGWRLAWTVGNAGLVGPLRKLKSWVDTGVFLAVQKAGAAVLDCAESLIAPLVTELAVRRDAAVEALGALGLSVERPKATMYLWVRLPQGVEAAGFAKQVLERQGVVTMPGTAFGEGGEGFFRVALTVPSDRLREAVQRIGAVLERQG
jgi:LL-diaminopimelate aminotransferase